MVGVVQGMPIDILIDSGALDVSLISSSVINHLSCSMKPIYRELKGVGHTITRVFSFVTLLIEFEEITLEVDLLVVPSESMNAPIIIGTDVLNREGVMYVRTKYYQRLTCSAAKVSAIEANEHPIKTSLIGNDYEKLQIILKKFSNFMITGVATSTVTTGADHSDELMTSSYADDMDVDIAGTRNRCNEEDALFQPDEGVRMSGEAV
ncbi:unnamed protein product, partial [Brenthis ino]